MGGYLISSIVLLIWKCIESHSNFLIKGEEVLWQQKILMTGSIMMDLILQMPRIPHPSESLLGTRLF